MCVFVCVLCKEKKKKKRDVSKGGERRLVLKKGDDVLFAVSHALLDELEGDLSGDVQERVVNTKQESFSNLSHVVVVGVLVLFVLEDLARTHV